MVIEPKEMNMIDVESVDERLQALRDYVHQLRPYQEWTLKALTDQPIIYNGVLHLLQLSIQSVIDVSTHIHVALDLPRASDYSQVVLALGNASVLPKAFAERIQKMSGFRNILVHGYLSVDPARVYERLQHCLADFEAFISHIYDFLGREGYLDHETIPSTENE
jgi:uncharacterized protein YutE (UPF0331/DUF86 family)